MLQRVSQKQQLPSSVFFYFFKLNEKRLEDFADNWCFLETHQAKDSKSIANILHKSAKHLKRHTQINKEAHTKAVQFLKNNIGFWEDQALTLMRKVPFNSQELSNSLWAYATLGVEPSAEFMKLWEQQAVEQIEQNKFNFQELSNSLWAYVKLGMEPSAEFMTVWKDRALKKAKLGKYKPQELNNSLWAIAAIDSYSENQDLKKFYLGIRDYVNDKGLQSLTRWQKQIYDSDLWFTGKSKVPNPFYSKNVSPFAEEARQLFVDANYSVDPEAKTCLTSVFKNAVDFSISDGNQTIFAKVDSLDRYVRNGKTGQVRYNGSTLFQSALRHKLAPNDIIVRIGHEQLNPFLKQEEAIKKVVCDNIFNSVSAQKPGVYGFQPNGQTICLSHNKRSLIPVGA